MKIYAIRDRLLDYYMQPFAGPDDKSVLAAIARTVNTGGDTSDVAQAPHHFEVWELGQVDQEGNLTATRKLVADCSSLVRARVWDDALAESREGPPNAASNGRSGPLRRATGPADTQHQPVQGPPQSAPQPGAPVRTTAPRGP